jgi:PTH1 family peptidyl-tRNA hydrolase
VLLIVGLGNPGPRYAGNRHNIGFMALDAIARAHNASPWRTRFQGEAAEAVVGFGKAILLKPQTYMNESGRSVGEAMRFYKLTPAAVVVFHDELDLAPAKLRVKTGGGNAGHNGLRSISQHIGNDYRRVRMGIGHPGDKALVHSYVLNDFAKAEEPWVEDLCRASADKAALLVNGFDERFQNDVALIMQGKGWGDVKRVGDRPAD